MEGTESNGRLLILVVGGHRSSNGPDPAARTPGEADFAAATLHTTKSRCGDGRTGVCNATSTTPAARARYREQPGGRWFGRRRVEFRGYVCRQQALP